MRRLMFVPSKPKDPIPFYLLSAGELGSSRPVCPTKLRMRPKDFPSIVGSLAVEVGIVERWTPSDDSAWWKKSVISLQDFPEDDALVKAGTSAGARALWSP